MVSSIMRINAVTSSLLGLFAFCALVFCANVGAQSDQNAVKFVAPSFVNTNDPESKTEGEPIANINEESDDSEPADEQGGEEEIAETSETEDEDAASALVDVTTNPTGNTVEKEPYDVYKENGVYFEGWDTPDVALVFTGMTNGYIEPCGCAGMERMKGGLSRRQTFLNELRQELGWETIVIDSGQITVGFGVQEELKFDMAMNAFHLMQYDAIGIGMGELRFPAYFLLTYTAPTSASNQSMYTSANVGVYGFHPTYTLPYKIIERGGKKVAVVSVVCKNEAIDRRDENIFFETPEKKLKEILPALEKAKCDDAVLMVHGTEEETIALAKKFPIFNYVLTSDTPSEPPAECRKINGAQNLIEVGEKGKYAIVVGLYADGKTRYQRVALDSRYESSPEITLLMKDYQSILKGLITTKGYKGGLGVNPARAPMAETLGKYVGAKKCRSCHEESYRVWAKSKHATAWKSLTETANPPRDFDPECIGCHVVGWDGLNHFPYLDGFDSELKTPELADVGCESCHGPGERHMALELGDDEAEQEKTRAAMRLGDSVKKTCYACHDGDNSPEFDFDKYYPLIEHAENDEDEE